MKKKIVFCVTAALLLALAPTSYAISNKAQRPCNPSQTMAQTLDTGYFKTAIFAVKAMYTDGTPLVSVNEQYRMNPASNVKTISTGAALWALGPDFKWWTRIFSEGRPDANGQLRGDLLIVGGGDPMLGSFDAESQPRDSLFAMWLDGIRKAGIKSIYGSVVADGRMDGPRTPGAWEQDDLGYDYGTCVSSLNYMENSFRAKVAPGAAVGDKLQWSDFVGVPACLKLNDKTTTAQPGTGDSIELSCSFDSGRANMTGTLALDAKPRTEYFSNYWPEYSLACDFADYLEEHGIPQMGEPAWVGTNAPQTTAPSRSPLDLVCETPSVPLSTVVKCCNHRSQNMYAEMLLRTIGAECGEGTALKESRAAIQKVLEEQCGLDCSPERFNMYDGSGMSRKNWISPQFFCDFLSSMTRCPYYDIYLDSMTTMCGGRVHYKTGSIMGCRSLCGYVLPKKQNGKTIVFSIIVNNSHLKSSEITKAEKEWVRTLLER